jgi:hypothetical protein
MPKIAFSRWIARARLPRVPCMAEAEILVSTLEELSGAQTLVTSRPPQTVNCEWWRFFPQLLIRISRSEATPGF